MLYRALPVLFVITLEACSGEVRVMNDNYFCRSATTTFAGLPS